MQIIYPSSAEINSIRTPPFCNREDVAISIRKMIGDLQTM